MPIFRKQTEVNDRLTAELSGQRTEGGPQATLTRRGDSYEIVPCAKNGEARKTISILQGGQIDHQRSSI